MKYIYRFLGVLLMAVTLVLAFRVLFESINSKLSEGLLVSIVILLIGFLPGILYLLHSLKTDINSKLMLTGFWLHIVSMAYSLITGILLLVLVPELSLEIVIIFFSIPVFIVGTILQIVYFVKSKIKHSVV